jgi:hypothetical protein
MRHATSCRVAQHRGRGRSTPGPLTAQPNDVSGGEFDLESSLSPVAWPEVLRSDRAVQMSIAIVRTFVVSVWPSPIEPISALCLPARRFPIFCH